MIEYETPVIEQFVDEKVITAADEHDMTVAEMRGKALEYVFIKDAQEFYQFMVEQ